MIYLDVTSFTARPELGDKIVRVIQEKIIEELKDTFPDVRYRDNSDLMIPYLPSVKPLAKSSSSLLTSGMQFAVSFPTGGR